MNEIFKDFFIDEQILDDFINIIKTFHTNIGNDNIYLTNKLINSLFNNNIYNNNNDLINKLMNKIANLGFGIDSSEIFLSIIQIYNDNDQSSASMLIKSILNNMKDSDISQLLKNLTHIDYKSIIGRVEVIFRHIITEKNVKQYKNNEEIKKILYEIFKDLTDLDKNKEYLEKRDSKFQNDYYKCIIELVSLLVQIFDNYNLSEDFFEKIESFLNKVKDDKLFLDIFRVLFYELYEKTDDILKYIDNSKNFDLNGLNVKQLDIDLLKYLNKLVEFLVKFPPIKEIILDLLFSLEKIYIDYQKNINTKNSSFTCTLTHIFNSKKIISGVFHLINEYQKNIILNTGKKFYIGEIFKGYEKLVQFLFQNILSPGYFLDIKKYLQEEKSFTQNMCFFEEIIQFIYLVKEEKKGDSNRNKNLYLNSLELIGIIYSSNSKNSDLCKDENFRDIITKYFWFLKQNKLLFSQYLITIDDNKKTILEYCGDLSIELGFDTFEKFFINDIFIKDYILKKNIKEKDYQNEEFNKLLKASKFKISEKPSIIHIIEMLILKTKEDPNWEKYLIDYFDNMKNNNIWKKLEKDNEELKIINNTKISNLTELSDYFQKRRNEVKENVPKSESKKNANILENNENECPLKKNCFLIKNKNIQSKGSKTNIINKEEPIPTKYGTFSELDLENIILCMKRDLLLKECSAYFYDIYFKDKNFLNLKHIFKYKYENNKVIKLLAINNNIDKLNHPVILKNYANNFYAYPQLYYRPYTSFYYHKFLKISHSYFNKNVIKKPSFPYFLPHYYELKSIIDQNKATPDLFNEECELIMKTNIMCGNIILKDKMMYFINNNEIKKKYGKDMKYLFSSLTDDIRSKEKIVIIKLKEIEEIIARRYVYEYRACEIFLKNGKSYYFNLYSKENLENFFKELEKFSILKNIIIANPIKYFKEKNYYKRWIEDEISTYQFLLYINKFASRSYNDVNQYPIFPWIFRETKLGSHRDKGQLPKFRDLRYPISVRGKSIGDEEGEEDDLEEARSFFDASLDENRKYPSHFRLHYSTSGYLLSFLVRASPYTEEQIRFQNNQFDSPSRQLNSIDEILLILSTSHDNRELIPEYFTSVEYFLNMNYIYFGYRLTDKVLINDVGYQEDFFQSIAQYVYYNRLVLNIKFEIGDVNKVWFKENELKINSWIDLIFGYKQWSPKPKREDLNLFGKYCYKQYINFDHILEKFRNKEYDKETIIAKIESKKSRIINFGQCPEVLFNKEIEPAFLPQTEKGDEKNDDLESFSEGSIQNSFSFIEFEKETEKNYNIVNFWVTQNEIKDYDDYIYFLVFEEKKNCKESNPNELFILIFRDVNEKRENPDYVIDIQEINLFLNRSKYEKKKRNQKRAQTVKESSNNNIKIKETHSLKDDLTEERKQKEENDIKDKSTKKPEYSNYYNYRLSPKNTMFDICCFKRLYFFIGRNIDNSIKVYEIDKEKDKKGKLRFNIPMDSFVSCVYKKDKNNFFSGHKNGKIYEWQIKYTTQKKNQIISSIEIIRDIIAHKDSMVCNIYYIEKHNVILTSSNDGKLFIRKYFNFELLTVIETNDNIFKFVYSDYDLLYLLTIPKVKAHNKSKISVYTLNGVLLESSKYDYFIDIEPMKNGKLFSNTINSNKLGIFGFNEPKGSVEEYNILSNFKQKVTDTNICNFALRLKNSVVYILFEDKYLYRQKIFDLNCLYKQINKLQFLDEQKKIDYKERNLSRAETNAI